MLYKNAFDQLQIVLNEVGQIKANLQKAYDHKVQKDYEACLWMLRNTLEGICKNIYSNEISSDTNGLELRQIIKKLEEGNKIPYNILPHIRTVQTFGNFGSHSDNNEKRELTEKMIQPPITSMEVVLVWFTSEYHGIPEKHSNDAATAFNLLGLFYPIEIIKLVFPGLGKIIS
jgi:hypothetical protein